jgi:hypothetical protein
VTLLGDRLRHRYAVAADDGEALSLPIVEERAE